MSDHGANALARADAKVAELIDRAGSMSAGDIALVNAPAGAGKTGLVTRLVPRHVKLRRRVGIITQTNEQADDLTRRLAAEQPKRSFTRLVSSRHTPPALGPNVVVTGDAKTIDSRSVVIATAHKWAYSAEVVGAGAFDIGLVDEAYQMAGGMLLHIADLFGALQLVGDPGQLSPFSSLDVDRWTGLIPDPTRNAVDTLRLYRSIEVDTLPITRRLPAHAAGIVREAFYPDLEFSAATAPGQRRLRVKKRKSGDGRADAVVDQALDSGWALARLPRRSVQRNDHELADAVASIVRSVLERGTHRESDEHDGLPKVLSPERIAIGASHRDQVAAIRTAVQTAGVDGVVIDTANRLQGREFDVVIAWHPLSGQVEASSFHLDVGRMCVLATRHRHSCIVVARDGADVLLESSVPVGEGLIGEPMDRSISGWEAHMLLLDEFENHLVEW